MKSGWWTGGAGSSPSLETEQPEVFRTRLQGSYQYCRKSSLHPNRLGIAGWADPNRLGNQPISGGSATRLLRRQA